MTREQILSAAMKIVTGERDQQYGKAEDSFSKIAVLWDAYLSISKNTDIRIDAKDVGFMMMLLKIARNMGNDKEDNFIDIAGYAACVGEIATGANNDIDE